MKLVVDPVKSSQKSPWSKMFEKKEGGSAYDIVH